MELTVDADERGKGHGSRLLQAAADTMVADRFTRAVTWLVADDDELRTFLTDAGWAPSSVSCSIGKGLVIGVKEAPLFSNSARRFAVAGLVLFTL